ncbi:MAG: SBBP repeat-containing protein, partial [Bacteroidia bacterium]
MIINFTKIFFSIVLALLFSISVSAQKNWLWHNGGAGNDEALDNAIDQNGNIFTTGYFSLTAQFNTISLSSIGSGDIFISKQDSNGLYQWAVQAGSSGSDRANSIATDNSGNVFIAGFFTGSASFGAITLTSSNNSQDVFVAKLDAAGNFIWANKFGGSDIDLALAINADLNGNVVVTGQFRGTSQFGSNTFTSINDPNTNAPSYDIFILKLDANGNFIWSKHGSAKYDDRGLGVSSDNSGNIYLTGQFSDTIQFTNTYTNNAFNAGFLLKLDASGNEVWMRTMFANLVTAYSVKCSGNEIYVTGDFQGLLAIKGTTITTVSTIYPYNIFVLKFDDAGNLLWAEHNGSNSQVSALDISVDQAGDAYIQGLFSCTFSEYSAFYGSGIFNSIGDRDVFISKFSSGGQLLWERQYGGSKDDFCSAIAIMAVDEPIIAGSFERGFNIPKAQNFVSNVSNFDSSSSGPVQPSVYCSDNSYRKFISVPSFGSKDIFSGKPLDLHRNPYDFYDRTGSSCILDIPSPFIVNPYHSIADADTLFGCGSIFLSVIKRTGLPGLIGPDYSYVWSTGSAAAGIYATVTGYYSVQVSFKDQCRSFTDSVYVKLDIPPALPTITTNYGTIHNAQPLDSCITKLVAVLPDVPTLYGGNITPGYIYYWQTPSGLVYSDSVLASPPGIYTFTVMSLQDSCVAEKCIRVIQLDTAQAANCISHPPLLLLSDSVFQATDTVRICKFGIFQMSITDSIHLAMDSLLILPIFISWTIDYGGINFYPAAISPVYTFNVHTQTFMALSSGYCSVTDSAFNPANANCFSVVTKIFYLDVLPLPVDTVKFNGSHFFCPGDTVMLTLTGGTFYSVSGPGIVSINAANDTLFVNKVGTYRADYSIHDTISGCEVTGTKYFLLSTNPSPLVTIIPSSGVICPGDSVQLIAQSGLSYNWVGPLGNTLGTTQSIYVHTAGYYHYEFIDSSGCGLISEFKEVKAYTTPYLNAAPAPILCPGGSVTIYVFTIDSTQIQWQPPLSGSSTSQVITVPGTYNCSVTVCG